MIIITICFFILVFFFPVVMGRAIFTLLTGFIMLLMKILGMILAALFMTRQKSVKVINSKKTPPKGPDVIHL